MTFPSEFRGRFAAVRTGQLLGLAGGTSSPDWAPCSCEDKGKSCPYDVEGASIFSGFRLLEFPGMLSCGGGGGDSVFTGISKEVGIDVVQVYDSLVCESCN